MMREVAALDAGNFRGVCPISNRANSLIPHIGGVCALTGLLSPFAVENSVKLMSGIACEYSGFKK